MNLFKRLLYLLLLLPSLLFGQKYQVYTGEYNTYVRHPATKLLYDVTSAGLIPANVSPLSGSPVIADEDQPGQLRKGSAALHHAAFIDKDGNVWTRGDGTGYKLVKTPVTNAAQVIAYANSGDGISAGLGEGIATLTNDGKIILQGNTQSGFRGDGTEGNQTEGAPFTVTGIPAVKKIQAGSYFFALGTDGVVYHWGGTRRDPYWSQFSCGGFTGSPNLTKPTPMNLPEPIVDIEGGADWSYAVGQSGQKYAWGYDGHYWGNASQSQQLKYFNLSSLLTMPGTMVQLAIGSQASFGLMDNGDVWAWGDNTQAQIGNGKEASFANFVAPWNGGSLWQLTPVKINPLGVAFVKVFTGIGDAFYVYAEDTNGNLWVWGRNKGFVLWNGVGGTSTQQDKQPNMWDVLSPTRIAGFGAVVAAPPPPVTPACPACPTCPPVVVCPAPVVCPVCPPIPAPRTVTQVIVHINGMAYTIPASWLTITFSDGSTQ